MIESIFAGEIPKWLDPEHTGVLYMNDMAAVAFCTLEQKERLDATKLELKRLSVKQDRGDAFMRSEYLQYIDSYADNFVPEISPKLQAWLAWIKALNRLQMPLISRLKDGSLRAFGDPDTSGSYPHWIAPRTWAVLRQDRQWARKMVGGGAVFWNVRVVDPCSIVPPTSEEIGGQSIVESVIDRRKTGTAGRPTSKHIARVEMRRRAEQGMLATTLAEETRYLCAWLLNEHPGEAQPTPKSLSDPLRDEYKRLRDAENNQRR